MICKIKGMLAEAEQFVREHHRTKCECCGLKGSISASMGRLEVGYEPQYRLSVSATCDSCGDHFGKTLVCKWHPSPEPKTAP